MERKDQRRVLGDAEIVAADGDTELFDLGDLLGERPRIDHHAVADHRELALAHHAGGQQRELIGGAVDHQRVAGIVAALEAHHDIGALRQPIDDLALALVAPLGADDHDIGHVALPLDLRRKKAKRPRRSEGPCELIAPSPRRCERRYRPIFLASNSRSLRQSALRQMERCDMCVLRHRAKQLTARMGVCSRDRRSHEVAPCLRSIPHAQDHYPRICAPRQRSRSPQQSPRPSPITAGAPRIRVLKGARAISRPLPSYRAAS